MRVIYENGYISEWLHLSKDENGDGYIQQLAMGNKYKKNVSSKKRLKKIQTLRKKNKL